MTTGDRKETVGFIGIGKMGRPMASRIAAQGYPLHVYDISEAALKAICNRTADLAKRLGSKILLGEVLLKSWADAEVKLGAPQTTPRYPACSTSSSAPVERRKSIKEQEVMPF